MLAKFSHLFRRTEVAVKNDASTLKIGSPNQIVSPKRKSISSQFVGLASLSVMRNASRLSHADNGLGMTGHDIYRQAEENLNKRAQRQPRRQGFYGVTETVRKALQGIDEPVQRSPKDDAMLSRHLIVLQSAIKGMSKMTPLVRSNVELMLRFNDYPGLQAAADGSGPLRSLATGLKVPKAILGKVGAEHLPAKAKDALERLDSLYDGNPALVSLGDSRAFAEDKPRTKDEVDKLMSALDEMEAIVTELDQAISGKGASIPFLAIRA